MNTSRIKSSLALLFAAYATPALCMNESKEPRSPQRKISDYDYCILHNDKNTLEKLIKEGITEENSKGIENNNAQLAITLAHKHILFPPTFADATYAVLRILQNLTEKDIIPYSHLCETAAKTYLKESPFPSMVVQANINKLRKLFPGNNLLNEKLSKVESELMPLEKELNENKN